MVLNGGTIRSSSTWTAIVIVIVVLLVSVLGYVLQLVLNGQLPGLYSNIITTVVLFGATFVIIHVTGYILSSLEQKGILTPHQKEATYRFIQLFTYVGMTTIIVIYVGDVALRNVILGAGVTSVVLALAARQTLSSVLAGIVLISTDVFRVGDWVKIDDRFGEIEQISLFNTLVRSPQGETHVFPNDEVIARDITNLGKDKYRNDVLIGIDYETDIDHAITVCDTLLEELTADETNNVDGYHPTTVKDFDESQITLAVKIWIEEPRPMAINQAQTTVLSHVKQQFGKEHITIPFPQRTLSKRQSA